MTTVPLPTTCRTAINIVVAGLRGDDDAVKDALSASYDDGFAMVVYATLDLMRGLAARLRTPDALLALDIKLSEISREHRSRDVRLAAEIIVAHTQTTGETSDDFYTLGVGAYNAACVATDNRFGEAFGEVMMVWRMLLPEVDTDAAACIVAGAVAQLWGIRGDELAPPKDEGTTTTVRTRIRDENGPPQPQPRLAIPAEAAVAERRPARAYLTPRAPVNLAGLAELRRREQYS
jgi:hypothetical protein